MSFSQLNRRLKAGPNYWYAFLTTKKRNDISRESTNSLLCLQLSGLSAPIWQERSITPTIEFIARLFVYSEEVLLKSDKIVVPLFVDSKFVFNIRRVYKYSFKVSRANVEAFLFLYIQKLCRYIITCETIVMSPL